MRPHAHPHTHTSSVSAPTPRFPHLYALPRSFAVLLHCHLSTSPLRASMDGGRTPLRHTSLASFRTTAPHSAPTLLPYTPAQSPHVGFCRAAILPLPLRFYTHARAPLLPATCAASSALSHRAHLRLRALPARTALNLAHALILSHHCLPDQFTSFVSSCTYHCTRACTFPRVMPLAFPQFLRVTPAVTSGCGRFSAGCTCAPAHTRDVAVHTSRRAVHSRSPHHIHVGMGCAFYAITCLVDLEYTRAFTRTTCRTSRTAHLRTRCVHCCAHCLVGRALRLPHALLPHAWLRCAYFFTRIVHWFSLVCARIV